MLPFEEMIAGLNLLEKIIEPDAEIAARQLRLFRPGLSSEIGNLAQLVGGILGECAGRSRRISGK